MAQIILKTTEPISYSQWIAQAGRFNKPGERFLNNPMPIKVADTNDDRFATIEIAWDKPLEDGFRGVITYRQHYAVIETTQDYDDDMITPIGEPYEKEVVKSHQMVKYNMAMSAAQMNALISAAMPNVPVEITGFFDRLIYCIGIIAIADAESYNTFELGSGKLKIAP